MASGALIGASCGVGAGILLGILFCLIFVYLKNRNDRKGRSRKRSFPPPGPNIIHQQSPPSFKIPPIVPVAIQPTVRGNNTPYQLSPPIISPTLSDGSRTSNAGARRPSVQLGEILTSVSMIDNPPDRKVSPASVRAANEPAIANLYKQKKKIGKKNQLKKANASSVLGKLEFSLFYDQSIQELQIYIMRALQVYVPGSDGPVNLAVKAVVLFDGEPVWQDKTETSEACSEPDFSEQLVVHDLPTKKMRKSSLRLVVLDDNTGQAAGEVVYPLSNLPFNQFTTETMKLAEAEDVDFGKENQDQGNYFGKLLISMCHNRNEKMLTVGVECAEGLPEMFRGTADSFVKVVVMHFGKKLHSSSTKVVNKTRNPEYDEKFDFVIPDDKLPQVTIYFKVKHRGKMMRDASIGVVKLGYDADHETEYRHLEQVLDKPHLCINNWHVIRKQR